MGPMPAGTTGAGILASLLSLLSAAVLEGRWRADLKVHISAACGPCHDGVDWSLWLLLAAVVFCLGFYCGYCLCRRHAVVGRPVVRAVSSLATRPALTDELVASPPSLEGTTSVVAAEQTTTVVRTTRRAAAVRAT
jgi:hypothetical protein